MKSLLMVYFIFYNCSNLLAQTSNKFEIPSEDQKKYTSKIHKYFRKLTCYDRDKIYSLYFLYHVNLLDKNKEAFTNDQLLRGLKLIIGKENARYPSNECLIYDQNLDIKGYSDDLRVTCTFDYPLFEKLLKYLIENELEKVFHISGTNGRIYFGIKQNEVLVFNVTPNELKVISLEKFKDCCFDELLLK